MRSAVTVAVLLASVAAAAAQVSPGPLSRPHAHLQGNLSCLRCHGAQGAKGLDALCRECHREIDWLIEHGRGLHAKEGRADCARCHPEHGGAEFGLVEWGDGGRARFDHARAGWPLKGEHARTECKDCHAVERFQVSAAARLRPTGGSGARGPRWIGLEPACGTCHEDIHRGTLGADCGSCHASDTFKVPNFDHVKTRYPLTGRHRTLACAKCHVVRAGAQRPVYRPLPFAECSDCHRDPHAGRLGPSCSRCHVTDDFRRVDRAAFDHERTRYPLRGRHRTVACARCHDPRGAGFNAKPAFARCGDCHADAHAGAATLARRPADCAACHGLEGFRPATFTIEQHALSAYPLEGKHTTVACRECHRTSDGEGAVRTLGSARVVLRPRAAACTDCHADAHKGQFAKRADRGQCGTCHTVDGWKPSRFGVEQHAATSFPLTGKHREASCESCHGPKRKDLPPLPGPESLGTARVAFRLPSECTGCHVDPHSGRYARPSKAAPQACLSCHDTVRFRPSLVDERGHGSYEMGIEGGHRAVPCVGCHKELAAPAGSGTLLLAKGVRRLPFTDRRARCEDCHADPHRGQFAGRGERGRCASCHDAQAFRPARLFDHDRDTRFRLAGAHARVACAACHKLSGRDSKGVFVLYRPAPVKCEECHRPGSPELRGRP